MKRHLSIWIGTLCVLWVLVVGFLTLGSFSVAAFDRVERRSSVQASVSWPVVEIAAYPVREGPGNLSLAEFYEITAYSHGCIMPRSGIEGHARRAANGRWPIADVTVAADTSLHPMGSEVLIVGLGFRTVGDRGSAIIGKKLDLFMDTCAEALRFGRQMLRVIPVPVETTREALWE